MKTIAILFQAFLPMFVLAQNLVSINPDSANASQTLNVTITGNATHFNQGSGTSIDFGFDQGSGTSVVNSIYITNNTSIIANITVPSNTFTGDYDVYAYNTIDGYLSINNGFHVNGLTPPSLVSISPNYASASQTLNVTITGNATHFSQGSGTSIDFGFNQGSGTSVVNSIHITSNTSIMANITVPPYTYTGDYDVYANNDIDGNLILMGGFHIGNAGIKINENKSSITIYPDPVRDLVTIETKQTAALRNSVIFIYDLKGKLLFQQYLKLGKTYIDISGLAKGIYILSLNSNDKTEVKRIVKE